MSAWLPTPLNWVVTHRTVATELIVSSLLQYYRSNMWVLRTQVETYWISSFSPFGIFLKSNSTGYYLLKSGIPAALLTPAIPRCPHSGPAVSLLCQAAVDRPADGTGSLGGPRPGLHTEGRLAGPGGFVGPPLCSCCELKPLNEQEKMSLWGHKAVNIYLLLQCS